MDILSCEGHKTWTALGYEYDCGYHEFDGLCEDCACCGGKYDPRYPINKQPKKLSSLIKDTINNAIGGVKIETGVMNNLKTKNEMKEGKLSYAIFEFVDICKDEGIDRDTYETRILEILSENNIEFSR